jgi:hypothetical protein
VLRARGSRDPDALSRLLDDLRKPLELNMEGMYLCDDEGRHIDGHAPLPWRMYSSEHARGVSMWWDDAPFVDRLRRAGARVAQRGVLKSTDGFVYTEDYISWRSS